MENMKPMSSSGASSFDVFRKRKTIVAESAATIVSVAQR